MVPTFCRREVDGNPGVSAVEKWNPPNVTLVGSRDPSKRPKSPFWAILGHFGPFWAILGPQNEAPNWPRSNASSGRCNVVSPGTRIWPEGWHDVPWAKKASKRPKTRRGGPLTRGGFHFSTAEKAQNRSFWGFGRGTTHDMRFGTPKSTLFGGHFGGHLGVARA